MVSKRGKARAKGIADALASGVIVATVKFMTQFIPLDTL
jgi:hypothetical protein